MIVHSILDGLLDIELSHFFPSMINKVMNVPVQVFVLKIEGKKILIDSGAGDFAERCGLLNKNIDYDEIDLILLTHIHPDHVGGLSYNGKRAFEKAEVVVCKKELDYWFSLKESSSSSNALSAKYCQDKIKPYQIARKIHFIEEFSFPKEIQPIFAPGHTPGHHMYYIESQNLYFIGDLIHFENIQIEQPLLLNHQDENSSLAAKTRSDFFEKIGEKKIKIAGAHIQNSGIIEVCKKGKLLNWEYLSLSR